MYMIIRYRRNCKSRIIKTGLTLEEAQEHCRCSSTRGEDWFDGYMEE